MANVCSNTMTITGPTGTLRSLDKLIESNDSGLLGIFPWFGIGDFYGMVEGTYTYYDNSIHFSFDSKWTLPEDKIQNLLKEYPDIKVSGDFAEPACECFGDYSTNDEGKLLIKYIKPEEWYYDNSFEFQEAVDAMGMPYDDFLNFVIEEWEGSAQNCCELHYLEKEVIKMIKKEDLPLLVDITWADDNTKNLLINKLKGE